jgi:hypothetical protein
MIGPFLIKLVEQPDVLGHYLRDPDGAFDAEGLTATEREILRSGNLRRLREALQEESKDRDVFLAVVPLFGPFGHTPQVFAHVPMVQAPDEPDPSE